MLESLEPVEPGRKCFRLVNGVLVERSVGEVVPAVRTNAEGLKGVLEGLLKEYKKKQEEMERWKVGFLSFFLSFLPSRFVIGRLADGVFWFVWG